MTFIKNLYTSILELIGLRKKEEVLPVIEVTIEPIQKPKRKYVRKNKHVTH